MKKKVTFADLFAGCGGLSYGLQQAGLVCKWANEIDENASATYRHNLGNHLVTADIREVDVESIPKVDVLVGGFPCQPFSVAGLQAGFNGKDGDLFYQCVRMIHALSPKVFMLENVAGFATLQKGFFLKAALQVLKGLGYHVSWKIIDCSDYSIPQTRRRILILGNSLGRENIYPEPTNKKVSVKEAIDDIWRHPDKFLNNEPMKHSPRIVERFSYVKPGQTAADALREHPELGSAKITKQCYRRMIASDPAPTIVANFVTTTIHYSQNRNLTAREAARIQTFPDTFEFMGYKTRMSWQTSLSQFEQIGNAVPPRLGALMGECILKILNKETPVAQEQMELDLGPSLTTLVPKKLPQQARGKTHSNRGRNSKYADVYLELEKVKSGKTYVFPDSLDEEFYTFLAGAMKRRAIKYEVVVRGKKRVFKRI